MAGADSQHRAALLRHRPVQQGASARNCRVGWLQPGEEHPEREGCQALAGDGGAIPAG